MPVSTKQLTICDFSSDFENFFNQNQTNLLTLLDKFIDISSYIPHSFYKSYYRQFGRDRKYSLESMISFFILKNILCISSIDTMINILSLSSELRSYCGFFKIPHKSQFSRFKSEFLDDINNLFHNLVDYTEDISKVVNPFLSSILITDTTGFDADDNYAYLYEKNIMPIIAINPRNSTNKLPSKLNEVGVPLCPKDDSLAMVYDGITRQKNRADRIKYICPKAKKN